MFGSVWSWYITQRDGQCVESWFINQCVGQCLLLLSHPVCKVPVYCTDKGEGGVGENVVVVL